ncbi:MAG: hypothetical protein NWE90_08585 [Candidatus Bathyarchaeota archaeon]|nr:hypothetical protein [Candidatus Bathyarchaeota archaeon]
MQKREILLILSLQLIEEFLLFARKRELFFTVFDAITFAFGVPVHLVRTYYDLIVFFSFLFSISLSYLLSLGFVKVLKLNRRLG